MTTVVKDHKPTSIPPTPKMSHNPLLMVQLLVVEVKLETSRLSLGLGQLGLHLSLLSLQSLEFFHLLLLLLVGEQFDRNLRTLSYLSITSGDLRTLSYLSITGGGTCVTVSG